ncbi:MAG: Spy/CpxP family protein refolding chaperone [Telmatospirillum sp.]|nr:Spy/CpxP family protein refolding chaperone [Telmatospirillum sp.]
MKIRIAAALALSLVAGAALAQDRPARERDRQPDRAQGMLENMCREGDARLASRLAYTEAKVKPTAAQRAAWDAFARDARAAAEPMKRLCANPTAAAPANDAAASLARRETVMAAMLEGMKTIRPALERLQLALNDEQKAALAETFEHRGRGHGHSHGHGMR